MHERTQAQTLKVYLLAEDLLDGVVNGENKCEALRVTVRVTYAACSPKQSYDCLASRKHTK